VTHVQKSILLSTEFIALLHWLCNSDIKDKAYIKQILDFIRFRETINSPIITLQKLEFYDTFNLSYCFLPSNVLPSIICNHFSLEELRKQLSLSEVSFQYLIDFSLKESQQYLFRDINTSIILLSFISQHWNKLAQSEWNKINAILSNIKCIPTTQGMKLPQESYIPSTSLSPTLATITLNVSRISTEDKEQSIESLENQVSMEFLKFLGCRSIHVPENKNARTAGSKESSSGSESNRLFIQELLKQRANMTEGDLNALKRSQCLSG
jgi:hypothetical protein